MTDTSRIDTHTVHRIVPFARHRDVRFSTIHADRVVAHLPAADHFATIGGGVHGGAIRALADISAAVLAVLDSGAPTASPATMQSSTNFLRPVDTAASAEARIVRAKRSTVVDVQITDTSGAVCVLVRQIVAVKPMKG